jgi:hypothetical protein
MTYAAPIDQANPGKPPVEVSALVEAVRACFDCANVCLATGKMLSRQTTFDPTTTRATLQICVRT